MQEMLQRIQDHMITQKDGYWETRTQSHCVHVLLSLGFNKKKEKLPTPPQTNLYSTLGYWHPKPPLSLISSMLYVDQGPGKEVVRRLQLSDSLYPLQNLWHLRQHCWETPNSPCLLFKTALVMFAWMNERLGVNSHIRAFSLATWSHGCFYKFTSKLTLFWVFSGLFFKNLYRSTDTHTHIYIYCNNIIFYNTPFFPTVFVFYMLYLMLHCSTMWMTEVPVG